MRITRSAWQEKICAILVDSIYKIFQNEL